MLVLPPSSTNWNVSHCSPSCPISLAVPAEVSRLIDIVVVEITELRLKTVASGTWKDLVRLLENLFLVSILSLSMTILKIPHYHGLLSTNS